MEHAQRITREGILAMMRHSKPGLCQPHPSKYLDEECETCALKSGTHIQTKAFVLSKDIPRTIEDIEAVMM